MASRKEGLNSYKFSMLQFSNIGARGLHILYAPPSASGFENWKFPVTIQGGCNSVSCLFVSVEAALEKNHEEHEGHEERLWCLQVCLFVIFVIWFLFVRDRLRGFPWILWRKFSNAGRKNPGNQLNQVHERHEELLGDHIPSCSSWPSWLRKHWRSIMTGKIERSFEKNE